MPRILKGGRANKGAISGTITKGLAFTSLMVIN